MWLLDWLQCSQQTSRSSKPSIDPTAFNDRAKPDTLSAGKELSLRPDSLAIRRKIIFEGVNNVLPLKATYVAGQEGTHPMFVCQADFKNG